MLWKYSLYYISGDIRNGGIGPPPKPVLVGCFKVNQIFKIEIFYKMQILSDFSVSVRIFRHLYYYLDKNVTPLGDIRGIEEVSYLFKGPNLHHACCIH